MQLFSFGSDDGARNMIAASHVLPPPTMGKSDMGSLELAGVQPDAEVGGFFGDFGGGIGKGAGIVIGIAAGYWLIKNMAK